MITNTDCTLYQFNGTGYDRYHISAVMWQEYRSASVSKQGLQSADGIVIYVPKDNIPQMSQTATQSPTKDIIIKGNCNFTFDNSSQQRVSESLKTLRSKHQYFTVMGIDNKLYGSESLQHIKITAR